MGRLSGSNKTPRLVPSNVPASSTIDELLRNNRDFGIPKWAVSSRNTFELHAKVYASLSTLGLGNDTVDRVHWCISRRIYGVFQNDIDTVDSEGWESIVNDPALEQGCDHVEGSQLEEEEVWTRSRSRNELNTSCSTSASSAASTLGSADSSDSTASDSNSTVSPRSATPSISSSNSFQSQEGALAAPEPNQRAQIGYRNEEAPELWSAACIRGWEHEKPTTPTDIGSFYDFECPVYFFDTISTDYISAHGKHLQGLELKGESTQDLAKQLEAILIEAVQAKDFSKVFASTRHFMLVDQAEEYVTSGGGIEREAIFILNQLYLKERAAEFLTKGLDDYATLATVPQCTARFMSEDKRIALGVLGAVVSLSLVYGMGAEPLNPILLMYCYNNCDMRSVLDELVREWHPLLHQTLKLWLAIGPDDSVQGFASHFATYHGTSVDTLTGRTPEMHCSLAWDMLHRAIVGTEAGDHPYFQAFWDGLMMRCAGSRTIANVYIGGPEKFVSTVYGCYVRGYSSMHLEHCIEVEQDTLSEVERLLGSLPVLDASSFTSMIHGFLEGRGAPCPKLLQEAEECFNLLVDLYEIQQPMFRLWMFNWAATGTPHVLQDGVATTVILFSSAIGFRGLLLLNRSDLSRTTTLST
ncbi:hypothetical protein WG66_013154 [Moniliophthora roreri]|nr:hypothetical protein WG66_013154 [Moniliophthora roreri]